MQSSLARSRQLPTLGFAAVCFFIAAGQAAALDLVGYVPNYRMTSTNYVNNILPRQIALLDEVRYFGITVNSNGSGALTTNATHLANIQKLKSLIDAIPEPNRPRLDITLGGWQMSDGFAAIAGDAAKRDALAQNIAALLDQTGATSVDLDWEHPTGGTQLNNYATTLQRIKQEVGSERHVYGTVEPTKFLPASVFAGPNAIDGTSLMTYDLGWWANDGADTNRGEHALPQYAADALSAWTDPPGTSNKRPYVFASWGKGLPRIGSASACRFTDGRSARASRRNPATQFRTPTWRQVAKALRSVRTISLTRVKPIGCLDRAKSPIVSSLLSKRASRILSSGSYFTIWIPAIKIRCFAQHSIRGKISSPCRVISTATAT